MTKIKKDIKIKETKLWLGDKKSIENTKEKYEKKEKYDSNRRVQIDGLK